VNVVLSAEIEKLAKESIARGEFASSDEFINKDESSKGALP